MGIDYTFILFVLVTYKIIKFLYTSAIKIPMKIGKILGRLMIGIAFVLSGDTYQFDNHKSISIQNEEKEIYTLNDARKNYIKRQKYLDDLLKGYNIPYCSGVVYDHDGSQIVDYVRQEALSVKTPDEVEKIIQEYGEPFKGGNFDAKTPEILQLSAQSKTSKIFIGRKMFEEYLGFVDNDLRHIIVAHEGRHVEQHALGLEYLQKEELISGVNNNLIRFPVLYEVGEYDANAHSLRRVLSGEFKVSKTYLAEIIKNYTANGIHLILASKNASPMEHKMILNVKEKMNSFPELRRYTLR